MSISHNANSLRTAANAVEAAGNVEYAAELRRQAELIGTKTIFVDHETQQGIDELTRTQSDTEQN